MNEAIPIEKTSVIRNNMPYILVTAALLLFSFIPFVMRGMSSDGVLYSGFAYNLAHGMSSLWAPFLTPTHWSIFHDHPPLSFYFHSLFLTYLGNDASIDKIYFFSTALASLSLVILFWRKCHREINSCFVWVPVLYWLFILENSLEPYRGNIDATLMVFTTLAAYLLFNACSQGRGRYLYFMSGSFIVMAAFFINGCQAFFLFMLPTIYYYTVRKGAIWHGIRQSVLLACITLTAIIIFLYFNASAWEHMRLYLFDKLLHGSLVTENSHDLHDLMGRCLIFWVIFKNVSIALFFSAACLLIYSKQCHQPLLPLLKKTLNNRQAFFFFLVALSASLPVIVTPHQSSRYIASSFPLWTLFFAELLTPLFVSYTQQKVFNSKRYLALLYTSMVSLVAVIAFGYFCSGSALFGKPVIEDIDLLKKIIPPKTNISIDAAMLGERWTYFLRLNLYRYMQITSYDTLGQFYYLQSKQITTHPKEYKLVNMPFQTFALYEHI